MRKAIVSNNPPTAAPDVAAEITAGHGLNLTNAAKQFPPYRGTQPVNPSTIWRWITEGIKLASGRRLRLEAIRLGGRWLTSVQAVQRFMQAQTPQFADEPPAPTPSAKKRRQSAASAARDLEQVGM